MSKDSELRQLHFVANPDRFKTTFPLVPDIAHRVTDCENGTIKSSVRSNAWRRDNMRHSKSSQGKILTHMKFHDKPVLCKAITAVEGGPGVRSLSFMKFPQN